jgi:flagellar protein FlaG
MANGNLSIPPIQGRAGVANPAVPPVPNSQTNGTGRSLETQPAASKRAEDFSVEQIRGIAEAFGDVVGIVNHGIRVEIDESSNQIITQVIDRQTEEVIRQIPPEELLRVSERIREFIGNILDEQG